MSLQNISFTRRVLHLAAAALCATSLMVSGCEKSAKEIAVEGKAALAAGKPDRAEEALKQALAKDPTLVEAERDLIRVHIARKDFDKAEAAALELGKKQGLDGDPKALSTEKKSQRQFHDELLVSLYKDWADSLDAVKNPQKLEEVALKGLERDPKDVRLNTILVDLYLVSADALVKDGKKQEAAQTYEKILGLRTMPEQRTKAQQSSRRLREEAFRDAAQARFDAEIKPGLVTAGLFDADKALVMVSVALTVDKGLKPNKPEDVSKARVLALPQVDAAIKAIALKMGGLPADTDTSGTQFKDIQVVEEKLERGGAFTLKASVPFKELMEYAQFMDKRAQKAEEKKGEDKKPEEPKPAEEAPAEAPVKEGEAPAAP